MQDKQIRDHFRRAYYEYDRLIVARQGEMLLVSDSFVTMPLPECHPLFGEKFLAELPADGQTVTYSTNKECRDLTPDLVGIWESFKDEPTQILEATCWLCDEFSLLARVFVLPNDERVYVQEAFLRLLAKNLDDLIVEFSFAGGGRHKQVLVCHLNEVVAVLMPCVKDVRDLAPEPARKAETGETTICSPYYQRDTQTDRGAA